jgi:hypothetical protein
MRELGADPALLDDIAQAHARGWYDPPPAVARPPAFVLSAPMMLFDNGPTRQLTKAEAQRRLDVPVRTGAGADGVRYSKQGAPDRIIVTCRQFAAANHDGYDPATNVDNVFSAFFERACGLLHAIARARPATRSYVDAPRVGVGDAQRLSSTVLPGLPWEPAHETSQERARRERTSVATFVREEHCTITTATRLDLRVRCADELIDVEELMRADVNGDGLQDIVVSPSIRSLDGTFSYTEPDVALSRSSAHGLLVPHPIP